MYKAYRLGILLPILNFWRNQYQVGMIVEIALRWFQYFSRLHNIFYIHYLDCKQTIKNFNCATNTIKSTRLLSIKFCMLRRANNFA